ncbi:MAG: YebC/PmpR family DNA-binding transcriptional regulator [bacterium]|nr:YebC/PmpR family DNA-binding transcriptional regulator [bacterium]
MSGHSHAKTVMAGKMANAAKKGKVFSKVGRLITIAAKEGGSDPISNSKLRMAIDQAKKFNMPKENIERAIKKGTGELAGEKLEEISFEGFGPGGITFIVEGITDNKNRALGEIKTTINQNNGKLAGEGAVRWMFDRKGVITINNEQKIINKDEIELTVIEAGAEDICWDNDILDVYTSPENLEMVKKNLEEKQIKIDSSSLDWVAKEEVEISEKENEQAQRLFEAIDDNDAVNNVYSNLK